MLTKSIAAAAASHADAERPSLRLAARGTPDPRADAGTLITQQVDGWHAQWSLTLETVKATLAALEQTCATAIEARHTEVAGLIDTLVQGAAADADAAAADARAKAQIEISELQQSSVRLAATVETLQAGLDEERETVRRLRAQLDVEATARLVAERERDELQHDCQRQASAAESQVELLRADLQAQMAELALAREQLEAALAERSKLMSTFRLVQRALALSAPDALPVAVEQGSSDAAARSATDTQLPVIRGRVAPEPAAEAPCAVPDPQRTMIEAHPEAMQHVGRVLEQVEAMYHEDTESGRSGLEIVDRLTANLRHARSLTVNRWQDGGCDPHMLFEYQVNLLLDRHASTSFGRHLGIATYALRTAEPGAAAS